MAVLSEDNEKKVQEYLRKEAWEMGLEEGRKAGMETGIEATIRASRYFVGNCLLRLPIGKEFFVFSTKV